MKHSAILAFAHLVPTETVCIQVSELEAVLSMQFVTRASTGVSELMHSLQGFSVF